MVQKNVPLDIVLVLDQSGSMAYTFSGNTKRQAALKNAVKNFISSVADKYDPETSDHRMAVVTFDSSASTLVNWTQVDGTGKDTLTTAIDGLPKSPEGGTQVGKGMQRAQTLLDNSTYKGSNPAQRTQVVIMFTDGEPGDYDFDISVANDAIKAAKTMKDNGVVVYTIGIFTGADPSQLYGTRWNANNDGSVGDYWNSETASANRYMNYVSSNFKTAADLGLEDYYVYHRITKNYTRDSSNYYLAASDADGLNNVFSTISSTIGGSDSTLTATATMVDVISSTSSCPKTIWIPSRRTPFPLPAPMPAAIASGARIRPVTHPALRATRFLSPALTTLITGLASTPTRMENRLLAVARWSWRFRSRSRTTRWARFPPTI